MGSTLLTRRAGMAEPMAPARDYCRSQRRLAFHGPSIRRVLSGGIVNPVVVVGVHIIANEPPQVLFVKRDDVVENLAAAASHPAFRNPVLPRCLNTRALRSEARGFQEGNHIGIEFRVMVEDGIAIRTSLGKGFTQLLHHPLGSRMTSDVEVQNPTPAMLDYEEAIQELEGQRGHGKEVEGDDHLAMVGEEREPASGGIAASPQALQISGDSALGDLEAELQQFPVDLRRPPVRILGRYAADESPNLLAHLRPTAARPRSPAPVQSNARAMPSDHSLWFHNDQNIRPSRPYVP